VDVDGGVDDGEVEPRELLELEEGVAQHVHVDLDGVFCVFMYVRDGLI
jgi:hypothetical protein